MEVVEIYGAKVRGKDCPYCVSAKALLDRKNIPYVYYDITENTDLQREFITRTNGAKTVPQIFVGIQRIGGFTELQSAEASGVLQQLIGGQ